MNAHPPGELRIVIADDCVDIADSMAELFAYLGYDVTVAYDGLAAVRAAVEVKPDAILLDIGMPGIDGYEAARRIRQQLGSDVLLIAVTAWTRPEDKKSASQAGFDRHIGKPADLEVLKQVLADLRAQKQKRALATG